MELKAVPAQKSKDRNLNEKPEIQFQKLMMRPRL